MRLEIKMPCVNQRGAARGGNVVRVHSRNTSTRSMTGSGGPIGRATPSACPRTVAAPRTTRARRPSPTTALAGEQACAWTEVPDQQISAVLAFLAPGTFTTRKLFARVGGVGGRGRWRGFEWARSDGEVPPGQCASPNRWRTVWLQTACKDTHIAVVMYTPRATAEQSLHGSRARHLENPPPPPPPPEAYHLLRPALSVSPGSGLRVRGARRDHAVHGRLQAAYRRPAVRSTGWCDGPP